MLLNFALFNFFFYLLPSFINAKSHNHLSGLAKSAIEHILIAIVWFYGFKNVFCQALIDFLFAVSLLFFL